MPVKTRYKGIYKKENGSYFFNYRIKLEDGTYKNICRQGKSASELNELKCRLKTEGIAALESDLPSYSEDIYTMGEACSDFLEAYRLKTKETTFQSINEIIKKYILYNFENEDIKKVVQTKNLQKWKNEIVKITAIHAKRKNRILSIFKDIMKRAFLQNFITQEEYGKVQLILESIKDDDSPMDKNVDFWTYQEFQKFYESIPDESVWKMFFWFLYYTGLRIGEILAIKPSNIDIKKRTLYIKNQLNKYNKITSTKSKLGVRDILLDSTTLKMIQEYITRNKIKNNEFIFPISRTEIKRKKELYCQLAGVKIIRIHDFRHSHVSLLINKYLENNLAIDFLTIAKRMGHSVNETMETYAHMYPSAQKNIIDLL